jgi:hypothetical protein
MKELIKKIIKEEIENLDTNTSPTVILVSGLYDGKYKGVEEQKSLLERGLGKGYFNVIAHAWDSMSEIKNSISTYPNTILVLFSRGGHYSKDYSSFLKENGGNLNKMYIVEPYSCEKSTKKSVDDAVSNGVPRINVLGGLNDCTGKNVAGRSTDCPNHWCALTVAGKIISNTYQL